MGCETLLSRKWSVMICMQKCLYVPHKDNMEERLLHELLLLHGLLRHQLLPHQLLTILLLPILLLLAHGHWIVYKLHCQCKGLLEVILDKTSVNLQDHPFQPYTIHNTGTVLSMNLQPPPLSSWSFASVSWIHWPFSGETSVLLSLPWTLMTLFLYLTGLAGRCFVWVEVLGTRVDLWESSSSSSLSLAMGLTVVEKWTSGGVQKMIFEMYVFFIVMNISPYHGNPRLLPTLVPYWVMSRHPKRKS